MTPLIVGILAAGVVGGVVIANRARAKKKTTDSKKKVEEKKVEEKVQTLLVFDTPFFDMPPPAPNFDMPPPAPKTPAELAAEAVQEAQRRVTSGAYTPDDWIRAGRPTARDILAGQLNAAQAEAIIAEAAKKGIDLLANLPLVGVLLEHIRTVGNIIGFNGDPRHLLDEAIKAAQARGIQIQGNINKIDTLSNQTGLTPAGLEETGVITGVAFAGAPFAGIVHATPAEIAENERQIRELWAAQDAAAQAQRDAATQATQAPITPDSASLDRRQQYLAEMETAAKASPSDPINLDWRTTQPVAAPLPAPDAADLQRQAQEQARHVARQTTDEEFVSI
jgi:hypothetical protein